jgi:hypothetical protein
MLFLTKKVLSEYHALVLKMHQDVDNNTEIAHNLEIFCDLEVMMGFYCIMPILEGLNNTIQFSQS